MKDYKKTTLKNGETRYIFDVSLGIVNGKRKRTTIRAKTVKEGRQKVAELQLQQRGIVTKDSMLFEDAYKLYLTDCINRGQAPNTIKRKRHEINTFAAFKKIRINSITTQMVQGFIDGLDYKPSSKAQVLANLSTFYKWATKYKIADKNPCTDVVKPKKEHTEMTFLTVDEFNEFLNHVTNDIDKLAYEVLFYSGLRKGELCALSKGDLVGNELHLSHNLKSHTRDGYIIDTTFKTPQSKRIVPIPKSLSKRLKMAFEESNETYPFANKYRTLSEHIYCLVMTGKVKRFRLHDLRHSYASLLIHKGVDIFTVSKILGHSNVAITSRVYGHLYDSDRQAITDLFD